MAKWPVQNNTKHVEHQDATDIHKTRFYLRLSGSELNKESHHTLTDAFLVPTSGVIYMPNDSMRDLKVCIQLYNNYYPSR